VAVSERREPAVRPDLQFTMRVYRPALKRAFDHPAGPFRVGEGVRFTGRVPPGHHAALVLATESGAIRVLAQADPADRERELAFPEAPGGGPAYSDLAPPGGTHVVLFAVSPAGPVTPDGLGLPGGGPWPRIAAESVLKASGGRVEVVERGRDFGPARAADDPEGAVRDRLTGLLQRLPAGAAAEGVVFAVGGE
jgi:hypothetical protein